MRREQLFDTAHEAFTFLRNYTKHGWLGYVERVGDKFKLVIRVSRKARKNHQEPHSGGRCPAYRYWGNI